MANGRTPENLEANNLIELILRHMADINKRK